MLVRKCGCVRDFSLRHLHFAPSCCAFISAALRNDCARHNSAECGPGHGIRHDLGQITNSDIDKRAIKALTDRCVVELTCCEKTPAVGLSTYVLYRPIRGGPRLSTEDVPIYYASKVAQYWQTCFI